jgi:hypothetical protein
VNELGKRIEVSRAVDVIKIITKHLLSHNLPIVLIPNNTPRRK